ncbi:sensor histidine kinase [Paucibacter sp. Y2R2-4]|uniref:sensor histidine kinase n=1 Tax=Paucibacter sp. Y2R2-4 TaxID=2893553 RepID=UPI0021E3B7F3|nr:HAMP domain-containing sensor histidine kinase [Paucibacter sp. Y2R2-4]MCV2352158.1 HAMP domain-containing histidine kinase [Paucibacter sp. Y2R2-4]
MKSLYLRIYLTLVVLLLAFAFGSAWLFQRHIESERGGFEATANERMLAMADLLYQALPSADAPREEQALAVEAWGRRLRMAIALNDASGKRIEASEVFERRQEIDAAAPTLRIPLKDGRSLELMRPPRQQPGMPGGGGFGKGHAQGLGGGFGGGLGGGPGAGPGGSRMDAPMMPLPLIGPRPNGQVLVILLVLLFIGVALGAYPVIRRLTRRLENLRAGVEQFGRGNFSHRVEDSGKDEVAVLAASFNRSAEQIEALLRSQKSLLANASHELRSPLARLKMAFSMLGESAEGASMQSAQGQRLSQEIHANIRELDALVEEVLLASRLEARDSPLQGQGVDLMGLAAEEAARVGAEFVPSPGLQHLSAQGDERLLRRALRNLLENARRYGGDEILLQLERSKDGAAEFRVCDRGPGVPPAMRERIFEAFFRMPGHAEQAGGVGLGLSLVKQIIQRHGGDVHCEDREGGGSVFVLSLPKAA